MQLLVSKISNLRGPDPPMSQKDRQTDNMQLQDRALHYCQGQKMSLKKTPKVQNLGFLFFG